jgi:hypothetical protein
LRGNADGWLGIVRRQEFEGFWDAWIVISVVSFAADAD